ncbi:DUF2934 domain-containing protein [Methylotenera mobilis]|jgi:hypothetical protein|uniref:DUF2934 domain-containing protein n=1 Tax=Methylotenera mobilis TaxID=359408 RepID=UPI000372197C|nr:DUF2934 domain-containing protein [Methylotenera mobilis]PPC97005.1 MAG: DUF2934 domain-containing protein [Methylotenera sp.]
MILSTVSTKDVKSKDSIKKSSKPNGADNAQLNNPEAHDKLLNIAVSAYNKAESRGFEPGHEIQDWLEAEAEVMK